MSYNDILFRLVIAILIGGIIGYEREYTNRPAGLRTHILVCISSAIVSMIQLNIIEDTSNMILRYPQLADALKADIGRLGAQLISGIGFLGMGTIIHNKGSVRGLTTAASIWVTACIGLSIGMGYYFLSFSSTVAVYIVVVLMKRVEFRLFERIRSVKLDIEYHTKGDLRSNLERYFRTKNIKTKEVVFNLGSGEERKPFRKCTYTILVSKRAKLNKIEQDINLFDEIIKATIRLF
jgi:putative Mg2+ transporter-C (MgtC) family protein